MSNPPSLTLRRARSLVGRPQLIPISVPGYDDPLFVRVEFVRKSVFGVWIALVRAPRATEQITLILQEQ